MPTPRPGSETQDEWMERCIPEVISDGTAEDQDQAVAVCAQMWSEATKANVMKEKLAVPFEIKALREREIEGHGSIFRNIDLGGDIVVPGAFKRSLAEHKRAGTMPQMAWMHDLSRIPGKWTEMSEDDRGLAVKGVLADTDLGNEMRTLSQMKAVRGLSIGFVPKDIDFDSDGNRLIKEIDLWEVSLVSLAMNPLARIEAVKARFSAEGEYIPTEREFEQFMRQLGCSKQVSRRIVAKIFDHVDDGGAGGMPDGTGMARWDAGGVEEPEVAELLRSINGLTDQCWAEVFRR